MKADTAAGVGTGCLGSHIGSLACTCLLSVLLPYLWFVMVKMLSVNNVREKEVP